MTCIVAIVDADTIWMGCDSYVGDDLTYVLLPPDETKVFKLPLRCIGEPHETLIFGYAGSIRAGQIIKYNLELPVYDAELGVTDMEYLINEMIPCIRQIHKKNGLLVDDDGIQSSEACFIVGWRKKLYYIEEDYGVVPVSTNHLALGSGQHIAHGALASGLTDTPTVRIERALAAAQKSTNHVREPFYIQHTL